MNDYTQISSASFLQARSGGFSAAQAIRFLEDGAKYRTLRENLERFARGRDLKKVLVAGLLSHSPGSKQDSVERRVRGWLNTESGISLKKMDAIEVCFILELTLEEAEDFVSRVCEESLHWRSPEEIPYIFSLMHGYSYELARELQEQIKPLVPRETRSKIITEEDYTALTRERLRSLTTPQELLEYIRENAAHLGALHNTAYSLFEQMLSTLEHPTNLLPDSETSEHLTIRDILKEYLYASNVLYAKEKHVCKSVDRKAPAVDALRKEVSKSWPNEVTISKMRGRTLDVSRKVLILLFLATDEGYYDEDDPDYAPTEDEAFESLYIRLNDMLSLCGFSQLDPRNSFDWLMLYCMCAEDMLALDEKMHSVFHLMFGEGPIYESSTDT